MKEEEIRDLLLNEGLITEEELQKAYQECEKLKRPLVEVILDMHLLDKIALGEAIAKSLGVEYKDLENLDIEKELTKIYPQDLATSTRSVPLYIKDDILYIAMEDPSNISLVDQVQLFTNYPIETFLALSSDIDNTLQKLYGKEEKADASALFTQIKESGKESVGANSIVKIVDLIISQAIKDGASDIHIEPEENVTRIRFRVDGILHEIPSPPKEWEPAIISRIKVLASLDIAESRIPQDGHFQALVDDKAIDFRVSTLPTIYGENVVLRLLDTTSVTIGLERLGFTTYDDLKRYEGLISKPYGIILSTGPTGSGKTTTLYSALMRINTPERNIITLEDPVEYRLGLIRQVQVNPRAGLTFASGLRAILRQDPDVIMVGEIRDLETARMAIQSALTGHLVFSTLHTNDAPSSVTRLVDMGVENFLVSASLIGVMAQRLVRIICPKCKEEYKPSKAVLKKWKLEEIKDLHIFRGKGCDECKGTGYKGRTGVYELMIVDDEIKEMINKGASTVELRKKAQSKGMRLLWEDGREKVLKGLTTFEEVARVCEEQVELKAVTAEVKPYTGPVEGSVPKKVIPSEVKVDTRALEDYRARISRWLGGK